LGQVAESSSAVDLAAEGRVEDEGWRVRKDGSRFWANIVMTALYDEASQPRGFATVTRDVTELHGRLEAFERERLLEDERHRMARELHDRVEQSFFGIGLTARGALDHTDHLAEPFRSSIATVLAFADQGADRLREAIFALNRPEVQDSGLVPSLWRLVRDFRKRVVTEADLVVSGGERRVSSDTAETLYAVAREALTNVERHAAASAVVLSLSFEPSEALLTVQDDGAGVSPLVQRTREDSATHFGLRSLRQRVNRLGGTFIAQPAEDGGFVVRACLSIERRTLSDQSLRPIRVLIVDDDEVVRVGLLTLLSTDPQIEVVSAAAAGTHAIATARERQPDVVLLDAHLPDLSGPDVCRRLRGAAPDAVVAKLTTFTDDELVRDCVRAGAQGYLLKHIARFDLRQSIKALARGEAGHRSHSGTPGAGRRAPGFWSKWRRTDAQCAATRGASTGGPGTLEP
jgi:signal transduction histidine kinase/CheY-like chemotaxis protein